MLGPYFDGTDAQHAFWKHDWRKAATLYERWVTENPHHEHAVRARLLAAVSHLYGGDAGKAAPALAGLVGQLRGLDDYVHLLAADAWLRAGKPALAIAHLDAIGDDDFAQARPASLLRARALAAQGEARRAAEAFGAHIAGYPSARPSVLLEAAEAMAALGPAGQRDVARALRTVVARAPHTEHARAAERRLRALPQPLRQLTVDELLVRLDAQDRGHRHAQALITARRIQREAGRGSDAWCRAGYREARMLEKQRPQQDAGPVFDELLAACELASAKVYVDILYSGAKRHLSAGRLRAAFAWFGRIQTAAPEHSYVDDTLLWQAQIRRDQQRHRSANDLLLRAIDAGRWCTAPVDASQASDRRCSSDGPPEEIQPGRPHEKQDHAQIQDEISREELAGLRGRPAEAW